MNSSYSIIGYSSGIGGNISGCNFGPQVIRERNLFILLDSQNIEYTDLGDVYPSQILDEKKAAQLSNDEKLCNNPEEIYNVCEKLYTTVRQSLSQNTIPIILGGDHTLPIGSVAAVSDHYQEQNKSIGLIWVDTHPDCNIPRTSPSKNIFGMSAGILMGRLPGLLQSLQKKSPAIKTKNIVYIGLRDVDIEERKFLLESGIKAFTMKDIDLLGMATVAELAIEHASKNTVGFYTSFDLDVCDPALAPATGTPSRGGLTFRESHLLIELIYDSKKMLAFDIVELNPSLDTNNQTADVAVSLILSACGKSIL